MATANVKAHCSICKEETSTFICRGCSKDFCFPHLTEHRQLLKTQLQDIQNDYNQFRQTVNEQKMDPEKNPLIQKIDQWETKSIQIIEQTARQCRKRLINYTNQIIHRIEIKLDDPKEQPKPMKGKNDFNEIDLETFREKLNQLKEELNQPSTISIEEESTSFINRIFVRFSPQLVLHNLKHNQTWKQDATTQAGGHEKGNGFNQLSRPQGGSIDDDQTIYVADTSNHRIVEWKSGATTGQIVAGGNGQGSRNDQLDRPINVLIDKETDSLIICDRGNRRVVRWPRRNGRSGETIISNIDCWDLIMDNDRSLYVSDIVEHEVRRWKMGGKNGTIVAGGNGKGDRLDQLSCPMYIFVDEDQSVYVSDEENHRVMKWVEDATKGTVVAGGQGEGSGLRQLRYPKGIIVDQLGSVYVVDVGNDRVMRWLKGAAEGTIVVGGNGNGEQPYQLSSPTNLFFDRQNHLYVVDLGNDRVNKFDVNLN